MEIAPDVGLGGGRGYYPYDQKPTFLYKEVNTRFAIRRHLLIPQWICTDGSIYTSAGLLVWKDMHEFCEQHFSLFGNGFMHICYHVSAIDNRIEFMRKRDAMLMKLSF